MNAFFSDHSLIKFMKWWHMSEWEVPILLMHALHGITSVLSEITLIQLSFSMKDFKPRSIGLHFKCIYMPLFSL